MAETDFTAIYPQGEQFRPAYVARQSGAGFRAPGFIGRAMSGAQPQAAPTVGAQTSGDANAALRGLYASRSQDQGLGVGEGQGAISNGQQPTREAQSFQDLLASAAMGGLAVFGGPTAFGAYMNAQDRRPNQTDPVSWGDVKSAVNPFSTGNSVIGRAAGAMYDSVIGSGPSLDRPTQGPNMDGSTVDRSYQGPTQDGSVVSGAPQGPNVDGSTVDMGPVQGPTEAGPTADVGGAGAGSNAGVDTGSAQGPNMDGSTVDTRRNGGMIGRPGEKPKPKPIMAHTGEFVQRPEAVNKYGPSAMSALNNLKAPAHAVKKATGAAPAKGKAPPPKKAGGARDALAGLRARG